MPDKLPGNPDALEGYQAAFVQGTGGSASQSLPGWQADTQYTLTVTAAQRSYMGTNDQCVAVMLDGQTLTTLTPAGTSYQDYTVGPFTTSAGTHTLSFVGLNPGGGDNTVFLDDVRLSAATAAPAYTYTGGGLRASKQVGTGPKTYFLYDGDTPVCQLDASGNVSSMETLEIRPAASLSRPACAPTPRGGTGTQMALKDRDPQLHYSNRGVQYASDEYTSLLKDNGFAISMSRKGTPYDNAKSVPTGGDGSDNDVLPGPSRL